MKAYPNAESARRMGRCIAVLLLVAGIAIAFGSGAVTADSVVVGEDDSADYESLQAALDDVESGETVLVRPGIYEPIEIGDSIHLHAPEGARIDASEVGPRAAGVTITGGEPVIDGLTVVGAEPRPDSQRYGPAVRADETTGEWELHNVTLRDVSPGVDAHLSEGDWTIRNATIANTSGGVFLGATRGDWTIEETRIEDSIRGVNARGSAGEWTIQNAVIKNNTRRPGVMAGNTTGAWTIRNTTVTNNTAGIVARETTGRWTVSHTTVAENEPAVDVPEHGFGEGIHAVDTSGEWTVHDSNLANNTDANLNATAADVGTVTRVWWGEDSPETACEPSVECAEHRTEPVGIHVGDPGAPDSRFYPSENGMNMPDNRTPAETETSEPTTEVTPERTAEPTGEPTTERTVDPDDMTGFTAVTVLAAVVGVSLLVRRRAVQVVK